MVSLAFMVGLPSSVKISLQVPSETNLEVCVLCGYISSQADKIKHHDIHVT